MPDAESLFYEATRALSEGNDLLAEEKYRQALVIDPGFPEAHANLAYVLERNYRLDEAEQHYRIACGLKPDHVLMRLNFGAMMADQKRFEEAENLYRQALQIDASSGVGWSNLGVLLTCIKREEEAEQCFRTALAIDATHRKAQFNLACLLLRQGRYVEGWQKYEARDSYDKLAALIPWPCWQGESLVGKSILIGIEGGHGDMIQFCRYASLLKQAGARKVAILCHPGLKRLLGMHPAIDEAVAMNEALPDEARDYWVPLSSLPGRFRTTLETIPASIPYLQAEERQVAYWAAQFRDAANDLRVCLVWKGNARFENDAERSLPSLSMLSQLWDVSGVAFYSLQKGAGEEEVAPHARQWPFTALAHRMEDFADTAAIVMNLDLVITVDTAVAHLAGALGKPCWVLLPDYKTDWRWLADRADSPWYPNAMRLFRQDVANDWTAPLHRVRDALHELAGGAGVPGSR